MDEMIVHSRAQLMAAIEAGARDTFEEARKNPFLIQLDGTKTVYTFEEGLHAARVKEVLRNVRRAPAKVFECQ